MITRPLELSSRLRGEPRSFDWLFFANAGLLVLFFSLFGSAFVLAPGLGVEFQLPRIEGANANARPPTHVINVLSSGQILTNDGRRSLPQLTDWLKEQGRTAKQPRLLVRGDATVSTGMQAEIVSAANAGGFEVLWAAVEATERRSPRGR